MEEQVNNKIIELVDVTKKYDDTVVIENVNLYVKKGEFITLLGPSGCGKTTTLRMIAGFEMPTSGKVLLNGKDISDLPPNKRPVNTVFQRYALFPHLNVFENIAFGLKLKKVRNTYRNKDGDTYTKEEHLGKKEIAEKVKKALEIVDLEGFEKRSISTLSGGQQQRIAIARAMLKNAPILILDEATAFADPDNETKVQAAFTELSRGKTVLLIAHRLTTVTHADRICVVQDGRIAESGTSRELLEKGGLFRRMWDNYQTSVQWKVAKEA